MSEQPYVIFQGGTLVIREAAAEAGYAATPFRWVKARWRCPAYHYDSLRPWFRAQGIRDALPRWEALALTLYDRREPHDYQLAALRAWDAAGRRGVVVLPTGAGKTFLALRAIQRAGCATLVVAPTIDLLHQWYARLVNAFDRPVGVYYGAEKSIEPLTVTTYHSAGDLIAARGNEFKLLIYDEVHHLPAPAWGESALMAPAPLRLGLTATYPDLDALTAAHWSPELLVGPIVYEKRIQDLVGAQLARYRTARLRIDLTPDERARYDAAYSVYRDYFQSRRLPQRYGPLWLNELLRRSGRDPEARRALLARETLGALLAGAEGKLRQAAQLLQEHPHEQALIFTASNDVVYELSRRLLIPAITHETRAAERKATLEAFRNGDYQALVTSRVLNEGIDVPEAKVAIVLGGTAGAREYIQRLGRVLRKRGNREAVLYEVIARNTVDEGRARRRRPALDTR